MFKQVQQSEKHTITITNLYVCDIWGLQWQWLWRLVSCRPRRL